VRADNHYVMRDKEHWVFHLQVQTCTLTGCTGASFMWRQMKKVMAKLYSFYLRSKIT